MSHNNRMKKSLIYMTLSFYGLFALYISSTLIISGCGYENKLEVKKININDKTLYVEIADEAEERVKGLQGRKGLYDNWGMLFVYEREQIVRFWMKDTLIPLDCAFIDSEGIIFEIHSMRQQDNTIYESEQKAQYVLEVNKGWFDDNSVSIGDTVEGLWDRDKK